MQPLDGTDCRPFWQLQVNGRARCDCWSPGGVTCIREGECLHSSSGGIQAVDTVSDWDACPAVHDVYSHFTNRGPLCTVASMSKAVMCLRMPPLLSSVESLCSLGGSLLHAFRSDLHASTALLLGRGCSSAAVACWHATCYALCTYPQCRFQMYNLPLQELAIGAENQKLVCSGRLLQAVSAAVAQVDAALQLEDTSANALNELVCSLLGVRIEMCLWTLGCLRCMQIAASECISCQADDLTAVSLQGNGTHSQDAVSGLSIYDHDWADHHDCVRNGIDVEKRGH